MKIAWRYQNLPQFGKSSTGHQFCNQYNINTKMNHEVISKCSPTTIDISSENESPPEDNSQFLTASCFKIANRLQTMIKDGLFSTSQSCSQRNILRIAIHSLGSPYWKEEYSKERWETDILRFLYLLKSMMRSAFSVAVISVPVNLLQNHVLLERMRLICDTVIRLEGFDSAEGEIHPAFKDYKGLLHVVKVHHLNLLKPHKLDTDDLAFCFRKRSLIFEAIHSTIMHMLIKEEDKYGRYAKLLMKHFLAEGVTNNHSILLASGDESPKKILEDLPSLITQKKDSNASESVYENEMKIAWRYQNLPQFGKSSTGHQFCNQYNINTKMNHEVISKCSPTTIDISSENESPPEDNSQFLTASCFKIANRLQTMIKDGLFSTSQSCSQRNILRIAIHSLGSPYWKEEYSKERWETDILRFLYLLKSMMRSAFSVAVISVPVNLLQNHVLLERMRLICDTVIRLEGFDSAEGEIHPAFKDYKGNYCI
ncbi:elongator complex protein 4-like [Centruroides sculpturatus]|uniref:elongator complex protein 4-like n=1 Tax=Centruroides sculpturatus TaxID=218467 RepID=UPI000C6EC2D7|nr:elongator complex protein 4-like [Centruroides sculpturatus]